MPTDMQTSGLDVVGKKDLLDVLISYYKAKEALKNAAPALDRHLADSSLEIISGREWYLPGGTFDYKRVRARWNERLVRVSAKGYAGMRVAGDTSWLVDKQAKVQIKRLNEELEQRVLNRTSELMKASEALRDAQAELAGATRLRAMGN